LCARFLWISFFCFVLKGLLFLQKNSAKTATAECELLLTYSKEPTSSLELSKQKHLGFFADNILLDSVLDEEGEARWTTHVGAKAKNSA
jgi:hypothetical protein